MRGIKIWFSKIAFSFYLTTISGIFFASKVLAQSCTGQDRTSCESTSDCMWTEAGCVSGNKAALADYINNLYSSYLLPIGTVIAVGMFIYAGIKYTTSSGSPDKISEAKEIFVTTLIGLVVLLLASLIIALINPNA